MTINHKFTDEQLSKILDQSLIYQCACPAQVCKVVLGLRDLYSFEQSCIDRDDTDKKVHGRISESTVKSHEEMEDCLEAILKLEGWDVETLEMPDWIKEKDVKSL